MTVTVIFGDPGYPHATDQGPQTILMSGSQISVPLDEVNAVSSFSTPQLQEAYITYTILFGQPNYPYYTDQGPHIVSGTKTIYVDESKPLSRSAPMGIARITPAVAGGLQDTGSNLTTQTTGVQASIMGPEVTVDPPPPGHINLITTTYGSWDVDSWFSDSLISFPFPHRVNVIDATRQSDGARTLSSPPNHYDQGTIEAWSWSAGWFASFAVTKIFYHTSYRIIPNRDLFDPSPGIVIPFTTSVHNRVLNEYEGTAGGCSRTLVVAPPTCTPRLRWNHPQFTGLLPHRTETFNPQIEHGGGGQAIRVFAVGTDQRTSFTLRNRHNLFDLNPSGNSYSYSRASPYDSGRNPSASGSGIFMGANDVDMRSELRGNGWNRVVSNTIEPANAIDFPGHYQVTWTPSWSSRASSHGWSGSELSGSVCEYEELPPGGVLDPQEGPQPHPSDGSVVGSLSLNVWIFAEPPTCTVSDFLFEVNEPIVPKVTLSNPNDAPMWLDVADSTISRATFSRTDSAAGYAGQEVPANGDLVIEPTVPSIDHSGEFVLNWKIQTNMGAETWTTLGTPRPPQRSWFEDPEERIVDSSANACAVTISKVVYRPFIKVFYGGLAAGGRFGDKVSYDACGENFDHVVGEDSGLLVNNSFVAGHAEVTGGGDVRGSSVEYALQANNIIGGFYSASQRSSDPRPLKGLTLSNNDNLHAYGGSFGRQACIAHYWREVEKLELSTKPSPLTLNLKAELDANERWRYELASGEKLELSASAPLDDLKATLYVEGDVLISENIIQSGGRWYDPSQIGYLSIIVKGNIDIDPDVTEINALLVAYPKVDTAGNIVDGRIRTCWDPVLTDPASPPDIHFHTCGRQLVVNGALIAEKVLFGRVHASVKQEVITPPQAPIAGVYDRRVSGDACAVYETQFPAATNTRSIPPAMRIGGYPTPETGRHYWDIPSTGYPGTRHYFVINPQTFLFWSRHDNLRNTCASLGHLLQMNVWRPGAGIGHSRGRAAIWLARALNDGQDPAPPPPGTPSPFTDVDDTQDWWPHLVYLANHPNVGIDLLGYKGGTAFIDNPTLFEPSSTPVKAWAAVLLAEVYNIPEADTFGTHHSGTGFVDTIFDDVLSPAQALSINTINISYEDRIRRAIHGLALATNRRGARDCGGGFYNRPGGWNTSIYAGCMFFPDSNMRSGAFARMLVESIGWSYNHGGSQSTTVRTTKASEVINLLPEYLIGIPELPLFGDQFYKTDSFSILPVNF